MNSMPSVQQSLGHLTAEAANVSNRYECDKRHSSNGVSTMWTLSQGSQEVRHFLMHLTFHIHTCASLPEFQKLMPEAILMEK